MNRFDLPKDLVTVIGNEKVDFAFLAKRKRQKSLTNFIILFAVMGVILPSIGVLAFFVSVSNDPSTVNIVNPEPMSTTSLLIIVVLIIGLGYLISKIISHYKNKKEYYVGTKNRMISYTNGNIEYFDWNQFTGNITLNFNTKSISLEMRNINSNAISNNPYASIPETLHLTGVENLVEIERICRERIKGNEPPSAPTEKSKYKSSYKQ